MPKQADCVSNCAPCSKKQHKTGLKEQSGFMSGLLLALLPKCPLCFMAFSGTAVLCGNGGMMTTRTFSSPVMTWLTVICAMVVFFSVLFNYRDVRTKYALVLVLAGAVCMLTCVLAAGGLALYYTGVSLLFLGTWLNASLLYFIGLVRRRLLVSGSH